MNVLKQNVLVLNRSWVPVHISTVKKSIKAVWTCGAKFVDHDDYQLYDWHGWYERPLHKDEVGIRTGSGIFRVPEVIVLSTFNKIPSCVVTYNRKNLFLRDAHTCQYCDRVFPEGQLTVDHVIPKCKDGTSSWTNCVTSCEKCNFIKADNDLKDTKLKLKKKPEKPTSTPLDVIVNNYNVKESWTKFIYGQV